VPKLVAFEHTILGERVSQQRSSFGIGVVPGGAVPGEGP
jgi:hypothetical protein